MRSGSTIASVRIGRWLSILLGIPLHDDAHINDEGALDNLFIVNGSTLYCKWLPQIAVAVRQAKNVIWVQNDYTLPPPKAESLAESPFRRAFADRKLVPHYWTTCRENSGLTPNSAWVNWNVLGLDHAPVKAPLTSDQFLYYGAYRESREKSFIEMYSAIGVERLTISSTSGKFPEEILVPPFREDLYQHIAAYGMGVYAQDERSTWKQHCPATRFYEMLSVGLPMCFMPNCRETLMVYDINVENFVLWDRDAADRMISARKDIAEEQQAMWSGWKYIEELTDQVKGLYAALDR